MMTEAVPPPSRRTPGWAAWSVSLVNGFWGDTLRDRANGLAIDMSFIHGGRRLLPRADLLHNAHPQTTGRLAVFVHGLGCHEGIWEYPDPENPTTTTTYGAVLQQTQGYTPFYLRYNTGLALAENGRNLARLIDALFTQYPLPISEIVLIGHSMGGLVIRSACHHGSEVQAGWVECVRRVFYLGTPHEGAPLAKFAHWTTTALQSVREPVSRFVGDVIDSRSQGVKDLRNGMPLHDGDQDVLWIGHARHCLIVGTLKGDTAHAASMLFGDGLVLQRSAKAGPQATAPWAGDEKAPVAEIDVFPGIHHLRLAHDPAICRKIAQQCRHG